MSPVNWNGDTFLLADIQHAQDLCSQGKMDEAEVYLNAIEIPEPHDKGRALHIWFQVSLEKMRCFILRKEFDKARALADQIVQVKTKALEAVNTEFWVIGFVEILLKLMRNIDPNNFMSDDSFRAYRDFIEKNKHIDSNRQSVKVYRLYVLGAELAKERGSETPNGKAFDDLLGDMTQDTVDLLSHHGRGLLNFLRHTMAAHARVLKKDKATLKKVDDFNDAAARLPDP